MRKIYGLLLGWAPLHDRFNCSFSFVLHKVFQQKTLSSLNGLKFEHETVCGMYYTILQLFKVTSRTSRHKLTQKLHKKSKSRSLEFFINFVPLVLKEENTNFSISTSRENYDMFTTTLLIHIQVEVMLSSIKNDLKK